MLVSSLHVGQLLMLQTDFFTTEWESFILKPQRIRRIRIKIQPTRIADRVFADKPPDPWIIVPVPIVVQPCFVIEVLALKHDRIGQAFLLCPFRALFFDFSPRPVLGASGDLAGVVGCTCGVWVHSGSWSMS